MQRSIFVRSLSALVIVYSCMLCVTIEAQDPAICERIQEIPHAECTALVALYQNTQGEHWSRNVDWLFTETPCTWKGITCENGHVTELSLGDNNLQGHLPVAIGDLKELTTLTLYLNQLTGSLPPELGKLVRLESLQLSRNKLTGTIPSTLGNLTNLQSLSLFGNQFHGEIPPELGQLIRLKEFWLANNALSGPIPPEFGNLAALQEVFLSYNQLSGSIPAELGNLTNLGILYAQHNQLSGRLPAEMGQLTRLKSLILSENNLEGNIPLEFVNLVNLDSFSLEGNAVCELPLAAFQQWASTVEHFKSSGVSCDLRSVCDYEAEIPQTECEALVALYQDTQGGSWTQQANWGQTAFPCSWENVTCEHGHVVTLSLSDNQLRGHLPSVIANLSHLQILDLSHNQLRGDIPAEVGKLTTLTDLNLSANQFAGTLPAELKNLERLTHLALSHNQFTGEIAHLLSGFPELMYANLGQNQFSGSASFPFSHMTRLEHLDLHGNLLTGNLDPNMQELSSLSLLNVADNQLQGAIPETLSTLSQLKTFYVQGNQFCEPTTTAFRTWLKTLEYDGTFPVCQNEIYAWIPPLFLVLVVSLFLTGIATGVEDALFKVSMTIQSQAPDDVHENMSTMINKIIVTAGLSGALGGVIGLLAVNYGKTGNQWVLWGIVGGTILGGIYGWIQRKKVWQGGALLLSILFLGGLFGVMSTYWGNSMFRHEQSMSGTSVKGAVVIGILAGFFGRSIVLWAIRMVDSVCSFGVARFLIRARFTTILCQHCLQYTVPQKSFYEQGIRYCEHCHSPVESTKEAGVVIVTFGYASPPKSGNRVFVLSDPTFEHQESPLDISEVYIDSEHADHRLLERFLTHIANYPPQHGLQSIQVFCKGGLNNLKSHVRNSLRNNFADIEDLD